MYNNNLSKIFKKEHNKEHDNGRFDKDGYPWPVRYQTKDQLPSKLFYAIGDSWLDTYYFNRVFYNNYHDYVLMNRSVCGMSNSLMIDTLKKDLSLLSKCNIDIEFLVSFSEVGRSHRDMSYGLPKSHNSTHSYFGKILQEQHSTVEKLLTGYDHYITTGFITNNFNINKSIVDFCGNTDLQKPIDVFTVYSNGRFEFLKDRKAIFDFDFSDDILKSLALKNFILSHDNIDDTLHPDCYSPYEDFLKNVFFQLQKK
jgi:hypothetical protein